MHAALVTLVATGAIMLPGISAMNPNGPAGHAFAKDGDGGDSDSGGDGGNSGSGGSSSGSGKDHSDYNDSTREDDSSRGRDAVTVSLSQDQIQSILSGQSRLVDNLGRTLELEIEAEDRVSKVTAKPLGGDARRNPGPIGNVSVVPAIN